MGKENFKIQLDADCVENPLDITEKIFTIEELVKGYVDNSKKLSGEIVALNGELNIRPSFQRAYVVEAKKAWKAKLISSILNHRPIGLVYFGEVKDKSGPYSYIVIDGQQRIITFCEFAQPTGAITMPFVINGKAENLFFKELPDRYKDAILNYQVKVKICKGSEDEIYKWFETINQESTILVPQELRNVASAGQWLEDAKYYFSATRESDKKEINDDKSPYCAKRYKKGVNPVRQECLEMALDWASYKHEYDNIFLKNSNLSKDEIEKEISKINEDSRIRRYMSNHKDDKNASELISFYKKVIDWVNDVFYHNNLIYATQATASQPWGKLYAMYSDMKLSEEEKIKISERCKLICDGGSYVYSEAKGIHEWVIRGQKYEEINKFLHLRNFKDEDKKVMFEKQGGKDPLDGKEYKYEEMEAHHIKSWRDGGWTTPDNLVMLSKENHGKFHRGFYEITSSQLRKKRDELTRKTQESEDKELEYALAAAE